MTRVATLEPSSSALVLASRSQARALLLKQAGLAVRVEPAGIDEDAIKKRAAVARVSADATAIELAEAKALAVSTRADLAASWVIGADQMLECDGRWFDQPVGHDDAAAQIAALAGRSHRLISAAAIARGGRVLWRGSDAASLRMRALSAAEIERYLACAGHEIEGTVGAYRLEGVGVRLFERVEGDYFTVLGLPLLALLAQLRALGAIVD